MRCLVAFDKFKDALSATEACALAAAAVRAQFPEWDVLTAPLSDGGEGFVTLLCAAASGDLEPLEVLGPRLQPRLAQLGWVRLESLPSAARVLLELPAAGRLAIVEMAQASGLEHLPAEARDPWRTSTYGVGQMIRHAIRQRADAVLVGLGGSATNDLGLGALAALGFIDLSPEATVPAAWAERRAFGLVPSSTVRAVPIRLACDVANPLLGAQGATHTFGRQKGLQPEAAPHLEALMAVTAHQLLHDFGHSEAVHFARLQAPGSGAAGGIGFGLATAYPDCRTVSGFNLLQAWIGLAEKLAGADWVLTGEGRFDRSSIGGKGPWSVVAAAPAGARCTVLAGAIDAELLRVPPAPLRREDLVTITPAGMALPEALRRAPDLLQAAVTQVCRDAALF